MSLALDKTSAQFTADMNTPLPSHFSMAAAPGSSFKNAIQRALEFLGTIMPSEVEMPAPTAIKLSCC